MLWRKGRYRYSSLSSSSIFFFGEGCKIHDIVVHSSRCLHLPYAVRKYISAELSSFSIMLPTVHSSSTAPTAAGWRPSCPWWARTRPWRATRLRRTWCPTAGDPCRWPRPPRRQGQRASGRRANIRRGSEKQSSRWGTRGRARSERRTS